MAGDWIKMRVNIDRDPKVMTMAESLAENEYFCQWLVGTTQRDVVNAFDHVTVSVTRDVVVAGLLRVWGVAIERGKREGDDLRVTHCNGFTIDEVSLIPGFGDAMEEVGWVEYRQDERGKWESIFPKFLVDNVPVEERVQDRRKEISRETSRRYREKKKQKDCHQSVTNNVTGTVTVTSPGDAKVTPREEKRREDNNTPLNPPKADGGEVTTPTPTDDYNDPPPANLASETFPEFWNLFPRKEHEKTCKMLWRSLIGNHPKPQVLVAEIISAVKRWLPVWSGRMPDKIPTPASWLEGERWKDELPTKAQATETEYKPMGKGPRICDDD